MRKSWSFTGTVALFWGKKNPDNPPGTWHLQNRVSHFAFVISELHPAESPDTAKAEAQKDANPFRVQVKGHPESALLECNVDFTRKNLTVFFSGSYSLPDISGRKEHERLLDWTATHTVEDMCRSA